MKIRMTNEAVYVQRTYRSMGKFQWAREFLMNSLQAKATRVEFGIEWDAVEKLGHYRRTVIDNGCGMSREELKRFFGTLGESGQAFGSVHDNFGLGAKLSALPWNPDGVVVISRKYGETSMITMRLDRQSCDYELADEDVDGKTVSVIDPCEVDWPAEEVDWSKVLPDWVEGSGTAVVFLGDESKSHFDTILGDPDQEEDDIKGLSAYLNRRFWEIPEGVVVRVLEPRSNKKTQWPLSRDDRSSERRPNPRQINGAQYFVTQGARKAVGSLKASGTVRVSDDRVAVDWYLWEGDRPPVHSYAQKDGFIAVRYKNELFNLTTHGQTFRSFGIAPKEVQQRLTLIVEPPLYRELNGRWGIHPDDTRQTLRFTAGGSKSLELPMADWSHEFVELMPDELREEVRAASSKAAGSLESDKYRDMLMQKYGDRWRKKVLVVAASGDEHEGEPGGEVLVGAAGESTESKPRNPRPNRPNPSPSGPRTRTRRKLKLKAGSSTKAKERVQVGFVPRYEWIDDEVGDDPWHIASWVRFHPSGEPTVQLSTRSTLYTEFVDHFRRDYAEVFADQVEQTVQDTLGQIIVCKAAHACTLSEQGVSDDTIDEEILTPANLTVALMGFLAEEAVIAQRLGPLGKKRAKPASSPR